MKKLLRILVIIFILYLFYRYIIFACFIWGFLETIILVFKTKTFTKISKFICNFVRTALYAVNYIINILLSVPANRILITSQGDKFGDPRKKFTSTLRINIIKGTIKPRGIILYKIIESIRNFGKHE